MELAAARAARQVYGLLGSYAAAKGATFSSISGEPAAKKYKYSRTATQIRMTCTGRDWFLVGVYPATIWAAGGADVMTLTAEQDALAVARLRNQYRVAGV